MESIITINKATILRVTEVTRSGLSNFIGQLIAQALLVAGFTVHEKAMAVMLEEVPKDIQLNFKLLEIPEIAQAFYEGVRGHYGEYYGITTVTIHKWLKSYIESGSHQIYLANKTQASIPLLAEQATKTQQEIDAILKKGIITSFELYKATGTILDYGSPKYDWLFTHKILVPDQEQCDYYISEAIKQVKLEISDKANSFIHLDRLEAARDLKTFVSQGNTHSVVQAYAKEYALRDFFDRLLENHEHISHYLP